MTKWTRTKLEEVATNFAMGPFGSNIKADNFKTIGIPVIRGTNLNFNRYVGGEFVYLTEEKANDLKKSNCFPGDLVFTHRGTIGQVALIPQGKYSRYVISQSGMKLSANNEKINNNYLFYFFKSNIGQYELLKNESQVGVPAISSPLKSLKDVDILLPPLIEQKIIAEVLASLDDKIDFLYRQNSTLEELAQTFFKKWFIVDADAKWEEKPLSNIANFLNGLACQKFPAENDIDKLPVLKIKDLKSGISDSSDWANSNVKPEYIIESGDVIFAWSASLMVKIWDGERCVLNQHLFKVSSDNYPKWFYYQWCKYHLNNFIAISQAHATTMGHIKRKDLDNAMCIIPSQEELESMNETMNSLFEKLASNSKQIKTLLSMRDTLLPKLISGEVRVKF